ncbi:uncharacterized protein LOC117136764 isoform X2 [Drosophila mauritiana]|uniref:Uncharacterized protein LOC117136764 isoform X2 n=1 Tax=Drosophila mauritiana TaxID=7226 RepID=A0A6P8JDS5_DROMA|nr:uncharacterized protein LOC117136764 isoform X2 [Drosophila mauritiana]
MENQIYERNAHNKSKCRRDLFATKGMDPHPSPERLYTYVYATAASVGQCVQPEVCSALLRALHSEQLGYLANCYRGGAGNSNATTASTCTITSATGSSTASRRPLQNVNIMYPQPYRTGSHFGFNSPRQHPRTEHKHVPKERDHNALGYRSMQRGISYEEIFATPRYEQLCQTCFDKLLRLKPELKRIGSGTATSSCAEEQTSTGSTPLQRRQLATLPELCDHLGEMQKLSEPPRVQRNAYTQTQKCSPSSSTNNFLSQIEKFNFSEESTNINYTPRPINSESSLLGLIVEQATSSAGASATSSPPQRIYCAEEVDITEVWSFGRWLEPQDHMIASNADEFSQPPLTEHCITLEFNQHYSTDDNQVDRQLMTREERQRRKSEFQELWQDHVEYFESKEQMHIDENIQEVATLSAYDCFDQDIGEIEEGVNDETMTEPSDELPKMLQMVEDSLTLAGENLEKLVESTKKLQAIHTETSPASSNGSLAEVGNLFRSRSFESIPAVDDTVSVQEPLYDLAINSSTEEVDGVHDTLIQEEKRDDEKPLTPMSTEPEEPSDKEKDLVDEKDIDENEHHVEAEFHKALAETMQVIVLTTMDHNTTPLKDTDENDRTVETEIRESEEVSSLETDNQFFTPLEREVLHRIEKERLDESEPIFGKIDHSIRNKMTPKKLQDLVSEEIFRTQTHVYTNLRTPISKKSLSAHNISAPCSSMAHTHLVTRPTPRMSRSWSEDQQSEEDDQKKNGAGEQGYINKDTPIGRVISSTTFVCRRGPTRKRNFIQENIRNASRPRVAAGSIKKHKSNIVTSPRSKSSPSSVYTFQCGQRDSGARLWVALPTSPRGQNSDKSSSAARALYTVRGNPPSPFAKRRRPLVILPPMRNRNIAHNREKSSSNESLHRTISSSTFNVDDEEDPANSDSISTSTFQLEEGQEESSATQHNRNATNSSVYYSANDTTREERESSQTSRDEAEENLGVMEFMPEPIQVMEIPDICSQLDEDGSSLELERLAGGSDVGTTEDDQVEEMETQRKSADNESKNVLPIEEEEINGVKDSICFMQADIDKDDIDNTDDQPSTSKAAMENIRICGGAEPEENPRCEDEDVVTLDTVCIVRGLEMFVREVEPIKQETSEELSDLGGLFENGLIDEGGEEAMSQ